MMHLNPSVPPIRSSSDVLQDGTESSGPWRECRGARKARLLRTIRVEARPHRVPPDPQIIGDRARTDHLGRRGLSAIAPENGVRQRISNFCSLASGMFPHGGRFSGPRTRRTLRAGIRAVLFTILGAFAAAVAQGMEQENLEGTKPIALVGDSYGRHEITSIIRNILDHEDWVFEQKDAFLPVEEWKEYALVVIAHAQERPYTDEEHARIRQYLESGGRLLLIQQAPRSMADAGSENAQYDWLGMRQRGIKAITAEGAMVLDDPILAGAAGVSRPSWISGAQGVADLAGDVQVLIGSANEALVARRDVGRGRVYYLGNELFRLRLPASPHVGDSDSYVALIRNILNESRPLALAGWQKRQAREWTSRGSRFLLWNREWQRGTETRPVFLPPLPSPGELTERLFVPMAVDEYEAVQVNLTDLGPGGLVTWKVSGLPPEALSLFVQDKPDPIPWPKNPEIARESPFWLMPAKSLDPKGEESVRIASGETRIFWLKFRSHGLSPGKHAGRIEFSVGGDPAGAVSLDLDIRPVRVPKRRQITVQPFGHVYGDVNDAAPAMRFKRNLQDLGFEWSLINTLRPATFRVDGQPITARFLKEHGAAIASDAPPLIDFSSMDAFVDGALEHNLTYFRVTQNLTESIDLLSRQAKLSPEDAKTVRRWYLREFARYLNDKGIRNVFVSMGDEMSVEELRRRFVPWSEDLAEAGWKSTSSFTTSIVADFALTKELARSVGAWTLNRQHLPQFVEWRKEGKILLPEGTLVGSYGAGEGRGTEIRKNASDSRMIGWEAWAQEADYCAPNPYFKEWIYYADYSLDRGIGGERFVSYLDRNDWNAPLVNSPFIEGIRESLEEANLAAAMSWYLEKLGGNVPDDLRARAGKIVGTDSGSLLRWRPGKEEGSESRMIQGSREDYLKAKSEVLAILEALRPLADRAGLKPDVFWNRIPLILDGKPAAVVAGSGNCAAVQDALQSLSASRLPEAGESFPAEGTVIFAGTPDDPGLPEAVRRGLGPHGPDASWIREIRQGDRLVLWIGGTDETQVEAASRRFVRFLRAPAAVFVP